MIDILSPLIKKFVPFAKEKMGFKNPPKLFLRTDNKNAGNPLGKTAFYDPENQAITLYVTGRHPKDVMRSLSHELVHHTQNCNGQFDDVGEMGEGYAQNDEHLREMEREAYETGNMCFRDWEDSLKSTIYYEHLQKGDKKMSTKDWKNKEITQLLSEAWGFKFNSLQEFDKFNGTGEVQEEAAEEVVEAATDNVEETVEETVEESAEETVEETVEANADGDVQEENIEEIAAKRAGNEDRDQGKDRMHADRMHEVADEDLQEEAEEITEDNEETPYTEEQIKEILRKALAIIKENKSNGQEK